MAKVNEKPFEDRIKSEQQAITRVSNDTLVCKDCIMRYDDAVIFGNTSKCEMYPVCKPAEILLGGKCKLFLKE